MTTQLADLFAGSHPLTQPFGVNPKDYARFGLRGHNGMDFGMLSETEVWSATDGVVLRAGDFTGTGWNGFGVMVEIWDDVQLCATLYGHLRRPLVKPGERVHARQPIALSDNSGNSTGPHLHFGVCKTDRNGVRQYTGNGFGGWLNPAEPAGGVSDGTAEQFHWIFTNQPWAATQPGIPPQPPQPPLDPCQPLRDQLAQALAQRDGEHQNAEGFRLAIAGIRTKFAELGAQIPPP